MESRDRELTAQKERLEAELAGRNPEFQRLQTRLRINPKQFQAVLPQAVVLVDFLEYTRRTPRPDGEGKLQREIRLAAFVVSRDQPIVQVDLGAVAPIIKAVERWRQAIDPELQAGERRRPATRGRPCV